MNLAVKILKQEVKSFLTAVPFNDDNLLSLSIILHYSVSLALVLFVDSMINTHHCNPIDHTAAESSMTWNMPQHGFLREGEQTSANTRRWLNFMQRAVGMGLSVVSCERSGASVAMEP